MRVIAIMNQKGGVGKTTTAINLAHAVALGGHRVLAIDLDPQGHLGAGLGVHGSGDGGMDRVLAGEAELHEVMIATRENLTVVPAGGSLHEVEHGMAGGVERGYRLRNALHGVSEDFDYIFFDCPPSAGLLGMNALFAAQELVIPVSGDYFALHGLSRFITVLTRIETAVGRPLKKWLVLTRYQSRRKLAREVQEKLCEYFPGQLLLTPIRETVALAECPSHGASIFEYQAECHGADDYRHLAQDLLAHRVH